MKTTIVVIVTVTVMLALGLLFANFGMKPVDNSVHKCEFSTTFNDQFCK